MAEESGYESWIAAARAGDKRLIGRLISLVENDPRQAGAVLRAVYPAGAGAWITGLTGAPGAGKSTLVDLLVAAWRMRGRRVAVLAVDPSSPFTGGALLGDRIRMQRGAADDDVLVRSMATRGWLGGMSQATERVATLCAGLGYDEILIETVGVGQSEVDIAAAADTTVVVVTPGWGDGVQVAKAGVMEIGDVIVVNKADRGGAADSVRELEEMLRLAPPDGWRPPVVTTSATTGEGLAGLTDALDGHRAAVEAGGSDERLAARRIRDLRRVLVESIQEAIGPLLESDFGREVEAEVASGATDPWTAAARLRQAI
jgi:LAO/AO transport system kinase